MIRKLNTRDDKRRKIDKNTRYIKGKDTKMKILRQIRKKKNMKINTSPVLAAPMKWLEEGPKREVRIRRRGDLMPF